MVICAKKKKIMIDNKIPVFPWLFEVRSLMSHYWAFVGIIEHYWHLCNFIEGNNLQSTHKHISGKWERGEHFMWVRSFFSGNIQQAYNPRMEFCGPPKTTQASGMIPTLIPEKVMLLTWNWTAWWCHNKSWTHSSQCLVMAVKNVHI